MDIIFGAFYAASGAGAPGLTVTIDVVRVALADGTESQVVTAQAMTESSNIDGLYRYRYASADPTTYTYFAVAHTAGTADQADLPATATMVAADALKIESADPSDTINAAADAAIADAALATAASIAALNNLSAAQVNAEVDTALSDVGLTTTVTGRIDAAISTRSTITTAEVNAEVLDVLAVDTFAEPSAVPAATSTLKDKLNWLFSLARNKLTQTATTQTLYRDDGSTPTATSTVSDDGTTATRGEFS